MNMKKAFGYLGLAQRARSVASGEFQTEEAVRSRKARVVVIAGDASDNTKKHFTDMCTHAGIPYCVLSDKDTLGHAIGKGERSSLAITDANLAKVFLDSVRE